MNFALIIVILTAVTGAVVLYDRLANGKSDSLPGAPESSRQPHWAIEYSRSFFPVLLIVLVIRSFIFEPFRIPSGSMMPTLLQGDFIFVKKYAYGLRLPVLETKVIETGSPARGDVVVFRLPSDPATNYIKRVVGLPGDRIEYSGHRLTINGNLIDLQRAEQEAEFGDKVRFVENLDGREHAILVDPHSYRLSDGSYEIPEGSYFMMGDNRDNSSDSRVIGPVPEEYLVGEAVRVWMHMDGLEVPRWERIGTKIQ